MSRYGIIDLGSNTIRLCIYEVSCAAHEPLRKKDIDTLLNYKVMAGLASHVEKGAMTEEGVKRAIKTRTCAALRTSIATALIFSQLPYCETAPIHIRQLPQSKKALGSASASSPTKKRRILAIWVQSSTKTSKRAPWSISAAVPPSSQASRVASILRKPAFRRVRFRPSQTM